MAIAMSSAPFVPKVPAYAYIDGGFIRQRLAEIGCATEVDPNSPAREAVARLYVASGQVVLSRVFYYDAVAEDDAVQPAYLNKIDSLPDTFVASTGFLRQRRNKSRGQKAVDVQLAVDALEAAYSRTVGAIVLITGDLDLLPLIEAIRRAGPHVILGTVEGHVAQELCSAADRVTVFQEASMRKWNPV
jgi:uncharacterized LabA/DUF88 family protein